MKLNWKYFILFSVVLIDCSSQNIDPKKLSTDKEKMSYIIGNNIGSSFRQQIGKENLDLDILKIAIKDGLNGKKSPFSPQEMQEIQKNLQKSIQESRQKVQKETQAANQKIASENIKKGEAFLAKNKEKEGVITTASGLQYKVIKKGTGATPTKTDKVKVHYKGTLISGEVFDSSYGKGQPIVFPVTRVIPGWTEALLLMPVGSKYQLFIPSKLAYGNNGSGPIIKPGSTLIFDVELLEIPK
ncbi:MAG: FKBP-type peptidyl-prolyl cis-trans isomerase [Spirochaetota bacterium]